MLKTSNIFAQKIKVKDKLYAYAEKMRGDKELRHSTAARGKYHDYLGMALDVNCGKLVGVFMKYCMQEMKDEFTEKIKPTTRELCNDALFKVTTKIPELSEEKVETFHAVEMKGMFLIN